MRPPLAGAAPRKRNVSTNPVKAFDRPATQRREFRYMPEKAAMVREYGRARSLRLEVGERE